MQEAHMFSTRFHIRKEIALLLVLAAIALVLGTAVTAAPTTAPAALQSENDLTTVYNEVSPSVVAISVIARAPNTGVLGDNSDNTIVAGGSGFVIDTDGHIVTNNHVVDGATDIVVNFLDGTLVRANVVGLDPDSDLAVLKVDLPAEKLHPVTFGNSDELTIGETVLAIGSPFGQRWTLTSGIVSALDRTIQGLTDFSIGGVIQTDASINPGNSGGPLLDLNGHVIGVNSQIISQAGSSSGVGFSIPSNLTQRVAQQLIDNGFVQYSYLGIRGGDTPIDYIEALGLPNDIQGVVVSEVTAGGPAARAGLQNPNDPADGATVPTQVDIITAINGQHLRGIADLIGYLARNTSPGDSVTLTVLRNGKDEIQLDVKLTPRP
jgi:S1-C subfamily serine protease